MSAAVERRGVAVLYAELRNFTRLSEVLDPAKVMALANEFFELVARHMRASSGRVLAVHNDSMLAVFTAAADAVVAAQAAQRDFPAIGERWQHEYGLPAAIALGAHLGDAVLGMAGPPGAQQFVAFGDCVSVAERLVHRARAGEIVLSGTLVEALGVDPESLGAERLPPLELARRPSMPIYGIVLETRLDFT
ncbi:MAG TPA: adenylate/guanylate cyclase domain-containing protein [Burkholderiales bacterium]|nr:adenylate/guanylate cyclase domain-containing protein [Burkholderiales bacterium]